MVRFGMQLGIGCKLNFLPEHADTEIFRIYRLNFPCNGMGRINPIGHPAIFLPVALHGDPITQLLRLFTAWLAIARKTGIWGEVVFLTQNKNTAESLNGAYGHNAGAANAAGLGVSR
ncbi:MAG: hypothetical protein B7X12_00815 [Halothiobacillus sp. 20-53-49]|nr:MAG: hypothetical protein B7X12_00815 [Halothiobacillus sp. 20-53-49]